MALNINLDVSKLWIKKFDPVIQDIVEHKHTNYDFPGGRGSTKSTFIGGRVIPILIMMNPNIHCAVFRQVGNTLKTSVYAQIQWEIFIFTLA